MGNNPDPVPSVRGANGASWNAVPLRVIPERGQVAENSAERSAAIERKQPWDVLQDRVTRLNLANDSGEFRPKVPFVGFAAPRSGDAERLAREPAANNVDCDSIGAKPLGGEGSHVVVTGHVGPMLAEDGAAVGLDFAERDGSHSGALEPEAESADAAEKVEDIHARLELPSA